MKKLVMIIIVVLSLSVVAGCGKEQSEEEKLAERINSEIDAYEEKEEDRQQQQLEYAEIKETYEDYKAQLTELREDFYTGDENTDYQGIADKYASLYSEVEEYLVQNGETDLLNNIFNKGIEQRFVDFKVNYLEIAPEIDLNYNQINYIEDEDEDKFILVLENTKNNYISCVFLFESGRTCLLDSSEILLEDESASIGWGKVTESTAELNIIKNADWMVYTYDITGDTAIQTGTASGTSDKSSYHYKADTPDINGVNLNVRSMMNY